MFHNPDIYVVLMIVFLATFIRSAFGFGEALIAVPLLALFLPIKTAAPIAVLISITVALIVTIQDWHHIHLRSAKRLILSTFIGTPIGLFVLILFVDKIVQSILGIIIMLFALYRMISQSQYHLKDDKKGWVFGFAAGILGGAYGMNGPPLVVYGALRGWKPKQFRATLQGYFLPASIVAMLGYAIAGLWTYTVTWYFLISLPVVLIATFLGSIFTRRISSHSFMRYIYAGLLLIGIILLIQSIIGFP
jgi:uncharacterized membrane protein YfcA